VQLSISVCFIIFLEMKHLLFSIVIYIGIPYSDKLLALATSVYYYWVASFVLKERNI